MSSETSTEPAPFTAGHFYVLLSMIGATAAVVVSEHTHPAALLLISGAVLAAGYTAYALHQTLVSLLSKDVPVVLGRRDREVLEQDKATVLRAIKDLEFDYGMKKVSEADYQEMLTRLKRRALLLMEQLEQIPAEPPPAPVAAKSQSARGRQTVVCTRCQTANEPDAKFCKQCGERLGSSNT
ncbi:MAG: hypothetical protein AMXMBFR57_13940 [Acidimicrobiia bacterium]